MTNYTIGQYRQICGASQTAERTYNMVKDDHGHIWLYDEDGDHIYYCNNDPYSDGFAGRTIPFKLKDGSTLPLKGPWHSNSDALKARTGVDLTNAHLIYGVVGMSRAGDTILDVIYQDEKPTIGSFNRIEDLAQEIANTLGKTVYYHSESATGSSSGPRNPKETPNVS